jgi:UDP-N-acetylglucosamine 2-epimerase
MLNKIFSELEKLKDKIIFPIHPRTKNIIDKENINIPCNILLIKPINYLDMTILERYCKIIITDSGGIQPEAWYLGKKCIIMRSETEWIEPLNNNNNVLYDYKITLNEFIEDFLKVQIDEVDVDCNVSEHILSKIGVIKLFDINKLDLHP